MDNLLPIKILSNIPQGKGVLWEHIEVFKNQLLEMEGVMKHQAGTEQSAEMADVYPLKQTPINAEFPNTSWASISTPLLIR